MFLFIGLGNNTNDNTNFRAGVLIGGYNGYYNKLITGSAADNTTIHNTNGVSQTGADDVTARGTIKLTSADGGVIKLTDGSADNSGLAKLGLEGQSEVEDASSGGVNVTTVDGATAALANIDKAIEMYHA